MKFDTLSNDNRQLDLNWNSINAYVSRYKPHTSFEVSITRRQAKVSDPMRRYYYVAVLPVFAKAIGHNPDEYEDFHRDLKIAFFYPQPNVLEEYDLPAIEEYRPGKYRHVPSVYGNESKLPISVKTEFLEWVIRTAAPHVYIQPAQEV